MKTERRHNLETNTLAKGLNTWSEKLRPYTSALLAAIALLLLVYIGSSMWAAYRGTRERDAWDAYELAVFANDGELKQLQQAASNSDFDGTAMKEWAYVAWADRQLLQASHRYLVDRENANERLTAISAVYEQFAKDAEDPEVRNRARLGLARASEMQNRLDEAREHYGKVDGALRSIAEERIKELDAKEAQKVVQWLATAELPKPSPPGGPGTPGLRPGMDATPPETDAPGSPLDSADSLDKSIGGIDTGEKDDRYGEAGAPSEGEATTPAVPDAPADAEGAVDSTPEGAPEASTEEPPAAEPQVIDAPPAGDSTEDEEPSAESSAAEAPSTAPAESAPADSEPVEGDSPDGEAPSSASESPAPPQP